MRALHERGSEADVVSVTVEVGDTVPVDFFASLVDGAVTTSLSTYVRKVREAASDREFRALQQRLIDSTNGDRLPIIGRMQELLTTGMDGGDDRRIFHTAAEFEAAPGLTFAIENFLQEDGVTILGGLSGHSKTLTMLSMVRSLLTGESLFGWDLFRVPNPSERVLYLIPESAIGPFWARIKLFRLEEYVRGDRLLVRTLSCREQISLDDVRILRAVKGGHIFLDTAVRFMDGSENDAENSRAFAGTLFKLLSAGARTITGAHHAPKGFEGADRATLKGVLRGSSDLGAMLCCGWALRQVNDETNRIFIVNVKCRDFAAPAAFVIEGRPHLDERGTFKMVEPPGTAKSLREYLEAARGKDRDTGGRPAMPDRKAKLTEAGRLRSTGLSIREIAAKLAISKSTTDRLLFEFDASQKGVPLGQRFRDTEPGTGVGDEVSPEDFPTPGLGGFECPIT